MVKLAVFSVGIFALVLPPFDIQAALLVGGAAIVVCAVGIGLAIAIPAIAITGTLSFATAVSIAGVSLLVGVVCAGVAGFVSGHIGDIKYKEQIDKIKKN